MKLFRWEESKNRQLGKERGVTFDQVVLAIERGDLLDVLSHPNARKYPDQRLFIVRMRGYAYLVPFVENEQQVFLMTIIPSRKGMKVYLRKD